MLYLVKIFAIKFLDKFMSTTRNILLIKHKILLFALADSLGFMVAILVIKAMNQADTIEEFLVMSVAAFLANLFSSWLVGKFDTDKEWSHIIQFNKKEIAKKSFDIIRENNMEIITFVSYNEDLDQTLTAIIKTYDRKQAKILKELIKVENAIEVTLTNTVQM